MTSAAPYHGGDLQEAEALFGHAPADWLDLSTGINPAPYPHINLSTSAWHRLPQPGARDALLSAARRYYEVPECLDIVDAPGSQAVLQLLPSLFPPEPVAILGPTYGEHAGLWRQAGHQVSMVGDLTQTEGAKIVVLVNPNNPDGRTIAPRDLLDRAQSLSASGGLLIVDEAFADLDPAISVLPNLADEPVLSVRSFGKFFGLPGLRLGFAAGPQAVVTDLRRRLGPWAVSGPALEIGARALSDRDWIAQTRQRLTEQSVAMDEALSDAGLRTVGGTALYRLVRSESAPKIFERLGRKAIFVRRFPDRPELLRFGLAGDEDALMRLRQALG